VRIEAYISANAKTKYPVCVAGNGACPPKECGGPGGFLARRDEAGGYEAYEDIEILSDFATQLLACHERRAGLKELELDEVKPAIERINSRVPYMTNKFSRALVNQNFGKERHIELVHQQLSQIVTAQAQAIAERASRCADCQKALRSKGSKSVGYRTVFGDIAVDSRWLYH
jgi:Plasmid pRiA4b ORF-3-like protein